MHTIRTLGDPVLTTPCAPVEPGDPELAGKLAALHEALARFRAEHGFGRAIAGPQLGIAKRCIALNLGAAPFAVINPEITWRSDDLMEVWDDCLSIPDRIVRVRRHRSISLVYDDEQGRRRVWERLPESMSELLQHEIDHLDGILMLDRAYGDDAVRPVAEHAALVGPTRPQHRLSLEAIARAAETLDPVFADSPQFDCEPLSAALGCQLTLKLETANPIRCFKGRGADIFLQQVVAQGDPRPLVCGSAGNFGQAMAYACRKHGRSLTVYASTRANPQKVERMRSLGATVELVGDDFDAAKAAARDFCRRQGGWMVEDGLEPAISEGAQEDKAGWLGFLRYLKDRGLRGIRLIVSDACLGLVESAAELYPEALWHKPKSQDVVAKLRAMKLSKAAELVSTSVHETLTYYHFPREHQRRLRTNNPLERILREVRRRTRVVGAFPDGNSALMPVAVRLVTSLGRGREHVDI